MFDIKLIRQDPEFYNHGHHRRGLSSFTEDLLLLDEEHRLLLTKLQHLQSERNSLAKEFGILKKNGKDTSHISDRTNQIKEEIPTLEKQAKELEDKIFSILSIQPNTPLEDVPNGINEEDNVCLKTVGNLKTFSFTPKAHYDLGEDLNMIDFEQAAVVSGSRFAYLKSDIARLERALANFMLDSHTQNFGYTEVSPPLLVNSHAAFGTAQLPKFKEDLFEANTGHWLISTSEISLTNLMLSKMVSEQELPLRFTAYTPCFRSEAGAAGRDTRGLIRLHQFNKVELVSITTKEQAENEFDRMVSAAETILQKLALPYRIMYLSTGDMGFAAQKTYDLEVWLPAQNAYREISSCSYCGDFQGRRMNARYRPLNGDKPLFVHTFNGSGLPTGRTLVAILENYQNADGSVSIPDVLIPYMGGKKIIEKA
ncbi:MAG: serine--tRNA ligase [Proteobacteria bacterium]|nr:serine--tRNA ligase [Pseudomonadota bacterium]